MLVEYEPGKAVQLAEHAACRYGLGDDFVDSILAGMGWGRPVAPVGADATDSPPPAPATGFKPVGGPRVERLLVRAAAPTTHQFLSGGDLPPWDASIRSMGQAVLAGATPERTDRLFPGDIEQFRSADGLGVAHGAAGVLYALAAAGQGRFLHHERWLLDLRQARAEHAGARGFDLFCGLAGVGLALLDAARAEQDGDLWDEVHAVERLLAERLAAASAPDSPRGRPGLMRGWAGPALFWIRLHEATGEQEALDRAAAALRRDLRDCILTQHGALEANDGWRTLPYLHTGGVGVGIVLTEYLRHAQDPELLEADRAIEKAACYDHYGMPTLSFGVAGILLYLCQRRAAAPDGRIQHRIDHMLSTLPLHALPYQGHIAFRGNQSLRLSMDLATGTAGVLLAVHTAVHGGPGLPFLPPARCGTADPAAAALKE
jgi:hypothetical protein